MKPLPEILLPIYQRNLERYEAENDPKAETQRRLIERLKQKIRKSEIN